MAVAHFASFARAQISGTGQYDPGPPNLSVGVTATGTLALTGVIVDRDPGTAFVGTGAGGNGTLTLSEGSWLQAEHLRMGGLGKARLFMLAGTSISSTGGTAYFDGAPGLTTEVHIFDGRLHDYCELRVGLEGPAQLNVTGPQAELNNLCGTLVFWSQGTGQVSSGAYAKLAHLQLHGGELGLTDDQTWFEPGDVEITQGGSLIVNDGATMSVQGLGISSRVDMSSGQLCIVRTNSEAPPPTVSAVAAFSFPYGSIEVAGDGASLTLDNGAGWLGFGSSYPPRTLMSITDGGVVSAGDCSVSGESRSFPGAGSHSLEVRGAGSHLNLSGAFRGAADSLGGGITDNKVRTTVSDGAELTADSIELGVGNNADGSLLLSNQARVTTNNVKIGVPTAEEPGDFRTTARVEVCSGSVLDVSTGVIEVGTYGTLKGNGFVFVGTVINNGVVQVGCSPGVLSIAGNYEDTTAAKLVLPLFGADAANVSRLDLSGTASISGRVEIELTPSFPLGANAELTVVTAMNGVTYSPDATVMLTGLTGGLTTNVKMGPDGVSLMATPEPGRADFNDDGATDLLDLRELANCLYGPAELVSEPGFCETDIDGDRDVDLRDYSGLALSYMEVTP